MLSSLPAFRTCYGPRSLSAQGKSRDLQHFSPMLVHCGNIALCTTAHMGVAPVDPCIKQKRFLSLRNGSWGKRVLILWCSSKAQSPNNRLAQEHGQRSADFLTRSKPRVRWMLSLARSVHNTSKQSVCSDPSSKGPVSILLDK